MTGPDSVAEAIRRPAAPHEGSGRIKPPVVTVGLVCALGVPLLYALVLDPYVVADATGPTGRAVVGYAVMWTLAGMLLILTAVVERRPLSTVGLRRPSVALLGLGVGVGVALSLLVPLMSVVIAAVGGGPSGVADVSSTTPWVLAAGIVTAAVTEEVVFRGYAIERLTELTGSSWIGAFVSVAVFVAFHVPNWSLAHVVGVVVPLGAALTGLYVWKRNLPFVVTVHFLVDAPLLVLALAG